MRRLQELPIQGVPATLEIRSGRWKCRNEQCARETFAETLAIALPSARKTRRVGELVRLFGHAAGGRVSERLLTRLGMPVSDNAILRQLKSHVRKQRKTEPLRAIAIDDWSWRKGFRYGTIVVDLERRTVADVLKTRSAHGTAEWLKEHPEIEFVSRDRCGLYAQGIRKGAPSARQVADRFHLMQNLRENIEREMTSVSRGAGRPRLPAVAGDRHEVVRRQSRLSRQALFVNAKRMHAAGRTFGDIAVEIGADRRTIAKWVTLDDPPDRQRSTIKPSSPLYFHEFLERRWAAGDRSGRRLFHDVRNRGYIGSFSHLERLLATWREGAPGLTPSPPPQPPPAKVEPLGETQAIDPATGWQISPMVAASLCMKPTPTLTPSEAAKVGALKEASPSFVVMRRLAMRFRGLLQGANPGKLDRFLHDARRSGVSSMQQFARTLVRDIQAVRNAITEPWSSGQAEGQINRLKALKRAMYGRASIELLRARMLPLEPNEHEK
ncbi:Transposase [Rhizobiales bacterium GAS113]|nr:Transposase [Rhizobiales bacterium GAS113]